MATIATLSDVAFMVSDTYVKTIKDYKRENGGRWVTHEIIGQKPILEFVGPGLVSLSFNVQLNAALGVNPKTELERLREICDTGEAALFVLAGEPVTKNRFILEKLSESIQYADGKGNILVAEASLSLKEYPLRSEENSGNNSQSK